MAFAGQDVKKLCRLTNFKPVVYNSGYMKRSVVLVLAVAAAFWGAARLSAQTGPGSGGGTTRYVAVKAASLKELNLLIIPPLTGWNPKKFPPRNSCGFLTKAVWPGGNNLMYQKMAVCGLILGTVFSLPLSGQNRGTSGEKALEQDVSIALSRMNQALADDEALNQEDGYYIGRAVGAQILQSYKVWENPALTVYLNKICGALVVNSPRPELYNGYHVALLDTREINAFATPGGHVFLTRGLADLANSEDALAAVIAHELAHIQLEHGVGIINRLKLTRALTEAGSQAAALAAREAALEDRKLLFGASVIELTNTLVKNGYSREQEYEADHYALALLALTGYRPGALVDMLKLLERRSRQEGGMFDTHPSPALRIQNTEGILDRYETEDTRSARRRRFRNR
jgi:hypothetical protein